MKLLFLIFSILTISCSNKRNYAKAEMKGSYLPQFKILLADSSFLYSQNVSINKTLILFYFSPFCPYCRLMIKDIIRNKQLFVNTQICMITYVDLSTTNNFIKEFKLNQLSNVKVGVDYQNFCSNHFSIKGVPHMIVYDKSKKLIAQLKGNMSAKKLDALITH